MPSINERMRFEYLDGIRGITALYVLLGHVDNSLRFMAKGVDLIRGVHETLQSAAVNRRLAAAVLLVLRHLYSLPKVQIFIVLSGYCLMLPVVQARGVLRGGFWQFIRRRALRILPAYYAMVGVALLVSGFIDTRRLIDPPLDDLHWGTILSHLFLVHNWSRGWSEAIDPPMWSIAVEWQIYFFFPLLLLPVWRRFGMMAATTVAFAIGLAPHFLMKGYLDWCCPWYLGLFALGMTAADINFPAPAKAGGWRGRLPWGYVSLALWIAIIGAGAWSSGEFHRYRWMVDTLAGLATMTLLVSSTRAAARGSSSHPALWVLGSRSMTWLGAFSYSIYLTHYPFLLLFFYLTLPIEVPVLTRAMLLYLVFVPLALGFAYVFYRGFERPFLAKRSVLDREPTNRAKPLPLAT